jgi:hypothetical protein
MSPTFDSLPGGNISGILSCLKSEVGGASPEVRYLRTSHINQPATITPPRNMAKQYRP